MVRATSGATGPYCVASSSLPSPAQTGPPSPKSRRSELHPATPWYQSGGVNTLSKCSRRRPGSARGFGGRYWRVKETAATGSDHDGAPTSGERLGRISVDWWATIVAGVLVLLAVAGLL